MDRLEGFSGDDDCDLEGKGACLLLWYPADGGAQPMAGSESQESLEGRLLVICTCGRRQHSDTA